MERLLHWPVHMRNSAARVPDFNARGIASGSLRQRVLGDVRGEAKRHSKLTAARAGVALAVGAIAVALALPSATTDRRSTVLWAHLLNARLSGMGSRGELQLTGLVEPPVGEVYEVWIDRGGVRPQPTNVLFAPTSAGRATVEVPGGLRGVRAVLITPEPLGGSSAPTGPIVLHVALPRAI
jgi:hypothetical protein